MRNDAVFLGTVALEPNRWSTVDPQGGPACRLSDWLPATAAAGFDGIELWDRHVTEAAAEEVDAVRDAAVPTAIFNSYVDLVDGDLAATAGWIIRSGASAVKFNVGNEPALLETYAARIADWASLLPAHVRLLCECHAGISIAEEPAVAASLLSAAGPASRVQAIVHTHEDPELVRRRFDAYGDRITHIHVNFLDQRGQAPILHHARERLEPFVALVRGLGFVGTWTIEFVHGTLTVNDVPEHLVAQATADLPVLREVLA